MFRSQINNSIIEKLVLFQIFSIEPDKNPETDPRAYDICLYTTSSCLCEAAIMFCLPVFSYLDHVFPLRRLVILAYIHGM